MASLFLLAEGTSSKCGFLNAAMDSCLLVGLDRGGLRVSQSWLDAALRECPAIPACAHQQKFDTCAEDPEANGGDLLSFSNLRQWACCRALGTNQLQFGGVHGTKVHDLRANN